MKKQIAKIILASCLSITCTITFADDGESEYLSDYAYGVDMSIGLQHQKNHSSDSERYSITLSPYLLKGNWLVGLDIPWHYVDGLYNFRGTARQESQCALITSGNRLPVRLEPYRDRISAWCANNQTQEPASGMGDINVHLGYGDWLNNSDWFYNLTLGYVDDNADPESYLGSGTRDAYVDGSISKNHENFSTYFSAGYNFSLGGINEGFYNDYYYWAADISTSSEKPWQLGLGVDYQVEDSEAVTIGRVFGQWRISDTLKANLQYRAYSNSELYPDSSIDANLRLSF